MSKLLFVLALFLPRGAEARYSFSDLLKEGKYNAEEMTLGLAPELNPLFTKYSAALKNPAVMRDIMPKLKPGQPMPYDSRFGITEAEYARLLDGIKAMKVIPTGQKVELVIESSGDSITVRTEACSLLKKGGKFDKTSGLLSLSGYDILKPSYFENHGPDSPLAPFDGNEWKLPPTNPPQRLEITVGRRTKENFCFIDCLLMNPSKGAHEDVLLRYDCVNGPAPTAPAAPTATVTASAPSGDSVLADFDKFAKADQSPAAAPPVAQAAPPPPPPLAAEVKVPERATGSPAVVCRSALSRYPYVTPSLYTKCKGANEHSAHVMNVYTYIYKGGMGGPLIEDILKVTTKEQEDCAVQIAKQYAGSMTTKYFEETCL
ncbi:MAG: hypothetical protein ACXWP1_03065 [Bdellovibrionota bacterium]